MTTVSPWGRGSMRISLPSLTRPERDFVSGLVMGYEGDAREGVPIEYQVYRLLRWRRQGWSSRVYHCNILAMIIGYQRARTSDV